MTSINPPTLMIGRFGGGGFWLIQPSGQFLRFPKYRFRNIFRIELTKIPLNRSTKLNRWPRGIPTSWQKLHNQGRHWSKAINLINYSFWHRKSLKCCVRFITSVALSIVKTFIIALTISLAVVSVTVAITEHNAVDSKVAAQPND